MSKNLSEFLDEPEILVESAIKKLEHLSGFESTDVRLLANVNIKLSVAKDLLRNHPPRKLMKALSYRSVDSMLKRENVASLFAVVTSVESPRWLNVFWRDLAKVHPSDFETREILIVKALSKYKAFKTKSGIGATPLLGAVVIWTPPKSKLELSASIAENISELRAVSAFIKLKNVEASFGSNLVDIIKNDAEHPLQISRLPISWRSIFHHYGLRSSKEHTEFFGPHILHEDIKAHKPLGVLASTSYVFNWWQDLEHVATKTKDGIVSFNLLDVIASKGHEFERRSLDNFRKSLWHEFVNSYFEHPSVEQHFMQQLEPQTVPIMDMPRVIDPEQEIKQMIEVGI
jgi:hypothetical protein